MLNVRVTCFMIYECLGVTSILNCHRLLFKFFDNWVKGLDILGQGTNETGEMKNVVILEQGSCDHRFRWDDWRAPGGLWHQLDRDWE